MRRHRETLEILYLLVILYLFLNPELEASRTEGLAEQHRNMQGASGTMALAELINCREKAYCEAMKNIQFGNYKLKKFQNICKKF